MPAVEIATQGWGVLLSRTNPLALVAGASVSIVIIGGATPATIWADNTQTTTLTQPLTTRSDGSIPGFIDSGIYIATWTIAGQTPFSHQVDVATLGPKPRGLYNSATNYALSDSVVANGLWWISLVGGNLGNNPIGDNGTHWGLAPPNLFNRVKSYGAKGDGTTDDTTKVQAALNAGGRVYLDDGVYLCTGLTMSQNGTTLFGPGTLKHMAGSTNDLLVITGSGCIVDGVSFDGNAVNQTTILSGINVHGIDNVITRCTIHDVSYDGIYIAASTAGIRIIGNRINTTGRNGVGGGGNIGTECQNLVIANNVMTNLHDSGIGVGITINASYTGNTINTTLASDGIACYDRNNYGTVCTGNAIYYPWDHGIHLGGNALTVTGNQIYNPGFNGIKMASDPNATPTPSVDCTVSGNTIDRPGRHLSGASGAGVSIETYTGFAVSGNEVRSPYGHGVQVALCADGTITGNQVRGSSVGSGCRVFKSSRVVASGNGFRGCLEYGIVFLDDGVAPYTDTCSAVGNIISSNGLGGISMSGNATGVVAFGNNMLGNGNPTISNAVVSFGNQTDEATSVAAGTSIVLPAGRTVMHVTTGGTLISISSASSWRERRLTFVFDGVTTVSDSGNFLLAGSFTSTADDTLTLVCDGTNWFEVARSVN